MAQKEMPRVVAKTWKRTSGENCSWFQGAPSASYQAAPRARGQGLWLYLHSSSLECVQNISRISSNVRESIMRMDTQPKAKPAHRFFFQFYSAHMSIITCTHRLLFDPIMATKFTITNSIHVLWTMNGPRASSDSNKCSKKRSVSET